MTRHFFSILFLPCLKSHVICMAINHSIYTQQQKILSGFQSPQCFECTQGMYNCLIQKQCGHARLVSLECIKALAYMNNVYSRHQCTGREITFNFQYQITLGFFVKSTVQCMMINSPSLQALPSPQWNSVAVYELQLCIYNNWFVNLCNNYNFMLQ